MKRTLAPRLALDVAARPRQPTDCSPAAGASATSASVAAEVDSSSGPASAATSGADLVVADRRPRRGSGVGERLRRGNLDERLSR